MYGVFSGCPLGPFKCFKGVLGGAYHLLSGAMTLCGGGGTHLVDVGARVVLVVLELAAEFVAQ
jgi:hypothetical protein